MKSKEIIRIRTKPLKEGYRSIYFDIYFKGKRSYEFLGMFFVPEHTKQDREKNRETERLVETIRAKRTLEFYNGEYEIGSKKESRVSLSDYISYLKEQKKNEGKDGSVQLYEQLEHHINLFRKKSVLVQSIDRKYLEDFKLYLRNAKNSNREGHLKTVTQANIFGCLKGCLKSAIKDELITFDPGLLVSPPKKEDPHKENLTLDEIKLLIKTPCKNEWVKRSFLFSCMTGLRISDIRNLCWGDIRTTDNGCMQLHFRQKKTKKETYIPLSENATNFLPDRNDEKGTDKVFKIPLNNMVNIHLKKWVSNAGITKVISYHCSRHTCATLLLNNGVDIYVVKELLGHSDIQMTMKYAKVVDKSKRDAVNLIPLLSVG